MDTSTMQLAVGMSTLIWALIFLITMAGGVVALTKRAPLLGAGLLVSGLFGGLGIIVHRALPALMAVVDDSASTPRHSPAHPRR